MRLNYIFSTGNDTIADIIVYHSCGDIMLRI